MSDTVEPSVRGSVAYRERIAMPRGAVVTVTVADTSRADAPERVVGRQVIADPGNVPVAFEVPYDPAVIDERSSCTIRATITVDGVLRWTTDTVTPVITRGAPTEVHLWLRSVPARRPDDGDRGGDSQPGTGPQRPW